MMSDNVYGDYSGVITTVSSPTVGQNYTYYPYVSPVGDNFFWFNPPYQYQKTADDLIAELETALRTEKVRLEGELKDQGKRNVRFDEVKKLMKEIDELKNKLK